MKLPILKPELYTFSPHQGIMLLLDGVEDYVLAPAQIHSWVEIGAQSVFFDSEARLMPPWIAFEYMAQSIALLSGFKSVAANESPRIGFIMGVREFTFGAGFQAGSRVNIGVQEVFRDGDVAVFEGTAAVDDEVRVKGTISTISASKALLEQMQGSQSGR